MSAVAKKRKAAATRRVHVRRVFGRVRAECLGRLWTFEMRKDGIRIRQFHKRRVVFIPLSELANHALDQPLLFPGLEGGEGCRR